MDRSIDVLMHETWVKEHGITREQLAAAWKRMLYEVADDVFYDAAEYLVGPRRGLGDYLAGRLNAALEKTGAVRSSSARG